MPTAGKRLGRLERPSSEANPVMSHGEPAIGTFNPSTGFSSLATALAASEEAWIALTQLSQLEGKSEQNQGRPIESLHYKTETGGRADLFEDVMRGGGCGGKSSLSCLSSSFWSALSSV